MVMLICPHCRHMFSCDEVPDAEQRVVCPNCSYETKGERLILFEGIEAQPERSEKLMGQTRRPKPKHTGFLDDEFVEENSRVPKRRASNKRPNQKKRMRGYQYSDDLFDDDM